MQRATTTERTAWMRSTYERALAEVAREHARAKAAPTPLRPAVTTTPQPAAAEAAADVAA